MIYIIAALVIALILTVIFKNRRIAAEHRELVIMTANHKSANVTIDLKTNEILTLNKLIESRDKELKAKDREIEHLSKDRYAVQKELDIYMRKYGRNRCTSCGTFISRKMQEKHPERCDLCFLHERAEVTA